MITRIRPRNPHIFTSLLNPITKSFATIPLPLPDPPFSTTTPSDHNSLCFSLAQTLLDRGLAPAAQRIVHRLILHSPTIAHKVSVIDFAISRGLDLDIPTYASLISRIVNAGEFRIAEDVYVDRIVNQGVKPDALLLGSMMICYCKLGKVKEENDHVQKLIELKSCSSGRVFSELVKEVFEQNRFFDAYDYCVRVNDAGVLLSVSCYNMLVAGLASRGYVDEALRVFDIMIERGVPPVCHLWKSLVFGFCKMERVEEAELLSMEMESYGFFVDKVMYTSLINGYCRNRKVKMGMRLFYKMLKMGCQPDTYTYNTLMQGFVSSGFFNKMWVLHGQMIELGMEPDVLTYQIMINKLCKENKVDLALALMSSMCVREVRPNVHCYTSIISALYKENRMEVDEVYQKMLDSGVIPDQVMFFKLMKEYPRGCFSQEGFVEHSGALIELMEGMGMIPNSTTFLVMVNEHCKHNDLASAFNVLRLMDDRRMKPSVAVYDCIIGCLSREKRVSDAHGMFKNLLESGVDPDDALYFKMINAYSKNGQAVEADRLFNRMMKDGIQPNSRVYSALISGSIKKNMMEKGVTYLGSMVKHGFMPNKVLYTSLIGHFLRKGELEFSFRLISLMERSHIECDHITYITLLSGICRNIQCYNGIRHDTHNKSPKEREHLYHLLRENSSLVVNDSKISITSHEDLKLIAMKLIRGIKDSSYMPNLYLYNGILSGFCRMGKFKEAYELLDVMVKQGVGLNQVTFKILINGHIQVGEIDPAVGLFNKMNADGCVPDRILYNTLIKGFCKNKRLLDALSLSCAMCKRGFVPSKIAYEHMLISLCASRLVNEALTMCEEMISHSYLPCQYNRSWLLHLLLNENKLKEAHMLRDLMLEKGGKLSNPMRQRILRNLEF